MNNEKKANAGFFVLLITYNFFFWQEGLGINLVLFSAIITGALIYLYRPETFSKNILATAAGTAVSAIMVVVFNSVTSKVAHISSVLLMVSFIHEKRWQSLLYAGINILQNVFSAPFKFYRNQEKKIRTQPRLYAFFRIAKLSIFPIAVSIIFYMIYSKANPIFSEYASRFFAKLYALIDEVFIHISVARILFLFLGAFLIAGIIFRHEAAILLSRDLSFSEKLERIKKEREKKKVLYDGITLAPIYRHSYPPFKAIALKNENRIGIILLCIVNVLLLMENSIDMKWLWFGFHVPQGFSLTHFVREGTALLIISMLLSMIILLYYFRKNLNFYPKNKLLKRLAYIWIAQNAILCVSVFLRNYHYIDFHGLAYKRIGVDIFLVLTSFGLVSILLKIKNRNSAYYLLKTNTWAAYAMLIFISCFNWDVLVAKYNLNHWNKSEIDVDFYLKLSDKALPVIYENLDKVEAQINAHSENSVKWISYSNIGSFKRKLEKRREHFIEKHEKHSWLSFNFADERAFSHVMALN